MTANELKSWIGIRAMWTPRYSGLRIAVKVLDARTNYGKTHLLISPANGTGNEWIDSESIRAREGLGGAL